MSELEKTGPFLLEELKQQLHQKDLTISRLRENITQNTFNHTSHYHSQISELEREKFKLESEIERHKSEKRKFEEEITETEEISENYEDEIRKLETENKLLKVEQIELEDQHTSLRDQLKKMQRKLWNFVNQNLNSY